MGFQSQRAGAASRHLTLALAAVAALALGCGPAAAQGWPNKPVTLIVPFAAGGGTDAFARPLTAQLDKQLNQRFLIDNRAGAGGTVGASAAAKAEPNGYNFFVGAAHHAIAPAIYLKLDYDLEKDFVPVVLIAAPPQVVTVNPSKVAGQDAGRVHRLSEGQSEQGGLRLRRPRHHASSRGRIVPDPLRYQMNHVPYRGAGPAMQDLVSGQIHVMFDGLGTSANQIQSGTLRGLAVAAPARSPAIPDVPTSAEAGMKGYEVSTWYALFAPKGTPPEIVAKMAAEVRKALDSELLKDIWAKNGSATPNLAGPEFGKFVTSEVARWGDVVKKAGIKPE